MRCFNLGGNCDHFSVAVKKISERRYLVVFWPAVQQMRWSPMENIRIKGMRINKDHSAFVNGD